MTIHAVEDIEEVRVLEWHKAEGDAVATGELVVELETSKAIVEIRSRRDAFLRKISATAGAWAKVGDTIAVFADGAQEELTGDNVAGMDVQIEVV